MNQIQKQKQTELISQGLNDIGKFTIYLAIVSIVLLGDQALADTGISWKKASEPGVKDNTFVKFVTTVMNTLMYVFAVVGVIIAGLAAKSLSGNGDWRGFWNKIAGSIGLFAIPAIVNWLLSTGTA